MNKKTIINEIYSLIDTSLKKNQIKIKNNFNVEKIKNHEFGDYSSNVALMAFKQLNSSPIEAAEKIVSYLEGNKIFKEIKILKPGFINFTISDNYYTNLINEINTKGNEFATFDSKDKYYHIEYVSANPTGLLHIGHARNAAYGSCMINVWRKYGLSVDTEYYVNDCGNQINKLGLSVLIRYLQLNNKNVDLPEDSYHGEEIKLVAEKLNEKFGNEFINFEYDENKILDDKKRKIINDFSKKFMLDIIKKTLKKFRCDIQLYYPESKIYNKKIINNILNKLKKYVYKKDGALWINTSAFYDDKDRVIIKSDGTFTYLFPDIIYHTIKLSRRNYTKIFDILGSDHIGYEARMNSALEALGYVKKLHIIHMQMVKLVKNNQEFKMSKRSGKSLTMDDLIELVGIDCARWSLVSQSLNSQIVIDIDQITTKNSFNQLYYVLYAYARINSLLSKTKNKQSDKIKFDAKLLENKKEKELMTQLSYFSSLIELIATKYELHYLTSYLYNLSSMFHNYYSSVTINKNDKSFMHRIYLINAIKNVIKIGLDLLNIKPKNKI